MKKEIILIGGGGHCKAVIDVIELENKFTIKGILDVKEKIGELVLNYPIIGSDREIENLSKTIKHFFICLGQTKTSELRKSIHQQLFRLNIQVPIIISPLAYVSKYSGIGAGSIIMHGTKINSGARIGENCILNTNSLIEHDVHLGNNCHVSTGAILNGSVYAGNDVFIGSNSVVADKLSITDRCVIGAGSTVIRSLNEPGIYAGNPVRKINEL